jgi:hypothetical protein
MPENPYILIKSSYTGIPLKVTGPEGFELDLQNDRSPTLAYSIQMMVDELNRLQQKAIYPLPAYTSGDKT